MPANWLNSKPSSDGRALSGRPLYFKLHHPNSARSEPRGPEIEGCVVRRPPDSLVIAKAQEIGAILLSLNGDFADIVTYPPKKYKGIVALQMRNHSEILPHLMRRLTAYLAAHSAMEHYQGKLFVVELDRIRIRE